MLAKFDGIIVKYGTQIEGHQNSQFIFMMSRAKYDEHQCTKYSPMQPVFILFSHHVNFLEKKR